MLHFGINRCGTRRVNHTLTLPTTSYPCQPKLRYHEESGIGEPTNLRPVKLCRNCRRWSCQETPVWCGLQEWFGCLQWPATGVVPKKELCLKADMARFFGCGGAPMRAGPTFAACAGATLPERDRERERDIETVVLHSLV